MLDTTKVLEAAKIVKEAVDKGHISEKEEAELVQMMLEGEVPPEEIITIAEVTVEVALEEPMPMPTASGIEVHPTVDLLNELIRRAAAAGQSFNDMVAGAVLSGGLSSGGVLTVPDVPAGPEDAVQKKTSRRGFLSDLLDDDDDVPFDAEAEIDPDEKLAMMGWAPALPEAEEPPEEVAEFLDSTP